MLNRTHNLQSNRFTFPLPAAGIVLASALPLSGAHPAPIPLGDIQWDVTVPGSFGEFDIVNQTGPNSSPPTWPVLTRSCSTP